MKAENIIFNEIKKHLIACGFSDANSHNCAEMALIFF
jgi:hypothetical protein